MEAGRVSDQQGDNLELQNDAKCNPSLVQVDGHNNSHQFSRFRDLPTEIRLMVWKLLLPEKRFFRAQMKIPNRDVEESLAHSGSDVLLRAKITFHQRAGIHQLTLSKICQESRGFLQEYAKLGFSAGAEKPGLWWMPETDVLVFCEGQTSDGKGLCLQELQGLEHIKHIFLDNEYASSVDFEAGCHPETLRDKPYEQAEIQILRLKFPGQFRDLRDGTAWPIFCGQYFSGLRSLTIHDDSDCENTDYINNLAYNPPGVPGISPFCNSAVTFQLGDMSTFEAIENIMDLQSSDVNEWTGPVELVEYSRSCIEGPIIATREGFSGRADQLSWRYVAGLDYSHLFRELTQK